MYRFFLVFLLLCSSLEARECVFTWNEVTTDVFGNEQQVDGYNLYWSTDQVWGVNPPVVVEGTTSPSLPCNIGEYWMVTAFRGNKESAPSNIVEIKPRRPSKVRGLRCESC